MSKQSVPKTVVWLSVKLFFCNYSFNHQLLFKDIESHRPAVEAVNRAAAQLQNEPRHYLKAKLDRLNSGYPAVRDLTNRHGEKLNSLNEQLSEFEKRVDDMEDWLLPTLQELESRECMNDDLPQLIEKLRVS